MFKTLKKSRQHAIDNKWRDGRSKNASTKNARNKKHCNKMKTIFDGLISRLDTVEEKISEFKNMSTELSELKCKEKKEQKKNKGK